MGCLNRCEFENIFVLQTLVTRINVKVFLEKSENNFQIRQLIFLSDGKNKNLAQFTFFSSNLFLLREINHIQPKFVDK